VLLVDNTPGGARTAGSLPDGVVYLPMNRNAGLAAALNAGLSHMPEAVHTVLFLDQDSQMPTGMVAALLRHLRSDVAVAAPAPWDLAEGRFLDPRTAARPPVAEMDAVITSGMLVRRRALEAIGGFREDFFVDGVDQDVCLRLRSQGWKILQDSDVRLIHHLGNTRWHSVMGMRVRATHHPSQRLYNAARNSAIVSRENLRTHPRWALTNLCQLAYWLLTIVLFEPPRRERATLFLNGMRAGIVGKDLAAQRFPSDGALR
jgi:rhamnosyltransferase